MLAYICSRRLKQTFSDVVFLAGALRAKSKAAISNAMNANV